MTGLICLTKSTAGSLPAFSWEAATHKVSRHNGKGEAFMGLLSQNNRISAHRHLPKAARLLALPGQPASSGSTHWARCAADACSRCRKAACCREQPSGFACCSGHKPGAFDASKLADYSGCKHPQSTALRAFRAAFDSKPAATTTCTNPVLCPSSTVNGPKIRPPTHQVWCLTVLCLLSTSSQTSPSHSNHW